jgi:hypothetical protein
MIVTELRRSKENSGTSATVIKTLEMLYRSQTELRALLWRLELVYTNNLPGVLLRTLLAPTSVFVKTTLQINVWQRNLPVIPGIVVFLHHIIIDDQNRKSLEFQKSMSKWDAIVQEEECPSSVSKFIQI